MLYAAKCYWPGITETELEQAAARAADALPEPGVRAVIYRGSLPFAADELVLCLFEAPSPIAVKRASDRAGIPCQRVMDSVWLQPDPATTN
jgi:Nickel responsive protein SCO4226-like